MELLSVFSPEFKTYGSVVENVDFKPIIDKLIEATPAPADGTVYVPAEPELEALPAFEEVKVHAFGGLDIELGYCNGTNSVLNCLEYHLSDELNIAADDVILLLAHRWDMEGEVLDTAKVKAFLLPAGTCVDLFSTTLHYAPCSAAPGASFRVGVVLPRVTNTDRPEGLGECREDKLITALNKWLYAHPDSGEAKSGAVVALTGKNIDVFE